MSYLSITVIQRPLGVLVNLECSTTAEVVYGVAEGREKMEADVLSALAALGIMKAFRPHFEVVFGESVEVSAGPERAPDWTRGDAAQVWVVSPEVRRGK